MEDLDPQTLGAESARLLASIVDAMPGGGEDRPGQQTMLLAVANAIATGRHLAVEAGTGTGKSLAYLVPALASGARVVVATATKALQDQLATKDLPLLTEHLDRPFSFALLKGRSNYVCAQRLAEIERDGEQLSLDVERDRAPADELARIQAWAETTPTGDQAELDFSPSSAAWAAVSVGPRECPGRSRCPSGEVCFAERARDAAFGADVTVVNLHLYGMHLASDGAVLGEHDIVVLDEAHQAEDILAASNGTEIGPGRFGALVRTAGAILADDELLSRVSEAGDNLADALAPRLGQRITEVDPDLVGALDVARSRVERLAHALRNLPDDGPSDTGARKIRAVQATTALIDDLDQVRELDDRLVTWVEGSSSSPVLRVTPIDISGLLSEQLWSDGPVTVLTSATLPANLAERLGLDGHPHDDLRAESPFDYENQAMLYCAADLPEPRDPDYRDAFWAELESLIVAAGGRTLALFTSRRAMNEAAEHLEPRLPWRVLTQDELPKPALIEAFSSDEESCLFATMSFWQGVDIPGPALSLVTIDRLPFPRPDDPVLTARRELAGPRAFRVIDIPRATMMLAQGAGRLIRSVDDRGVVAVLDSRLARSKSYRWDFVNALPPMRRTRDRAEVEAFLRTLRDGPAQ